MAYRPMDILLDVFLALELLRPIKPFRIWMCATSFKRLDKFDQGLLQGVQTRFV